MGLFERVTSDGQVGSPEPLSVHAFCSALAELAEGGAGAPTRAQLVAGFSLDAEDEANLDAIKLTYDGLSEVNKTRFLERIQRVFLLAQEGHYTKSRAKTRLGF